MRRAQGSLLSVPGGHPGTRILSVLLAGMVVAGCGVSTVADPGGEGLLTGLADCGGPDGTVAAFWGSDQGAGPPSDREGAPAGGDIWSIAADGSVTQLTKDARSRDPYISDDAQRIYFTRGAGGLDADAAAPGTELWVLDLRTGEESMVYDADQRAASISRVEESPDGAVVAFAANLDDDVPRVYVLDLETLGAPVALELQPAKNGYPHRMQTSPTWSPDGSQLAYVHVETDESTGWRSSVRTVDMTTGEDSLVYQARDERSYLLSLQWSSDGRRFIAAAKGDETEGFAGVSIDATSGTQEVLVDRVPLDIAAASSDATKFSSIGLTNEQVEDGAFTAEPTLTTWSEGEAVRDELPRYLSFAMQLTIADCSYDPQNERVD